MTHKTERKKNKNRRVQSRPEWGLRRMALAIAAAVFIVAGVVWAVLEGKPFGEPAPQPVALGGPFELTDHHGNRVTDKDFLGQFLLVYFGYTYCPDVCPTGLQNVAEALDRLPPEQVGNFRLAMITVDPARDKPEHLGEYVAYFHENFVGLTGSEAEIAAVAERYRAKYAKVETGSANEYLMDHTAIFFLVGPDGKYVTRFPYAIEPEDLAGRLAKLL